MSSSKSGSCLRPELGKCVYRRAIVGICAQFMLWYGLFNIVTGRTTSKRWLEPSLNKDLGYVCIGAVVSILSGSLLPMSGLSGSFYRPSTIRKYGLLLWIFGLASAVFLWAGLFNLVQAGFYMDNFCSNFPHEGDCDISEDGTLGLILCGPYYCSANDRGHDCVNHACRIPMNSYNYQGKESTDYKWFQDLAYAFIGFIGAGICTGIWSLGCVYPHWHGIYWAEVIVPKDTLGNYVGWHSRALLSSFFQCVLWVGVYNLLQYDEIYKNSKGDVDVSLMVTRDIVCILISVFIMYVTGGLVGAAWLDDEPLQSAWYNLIEDICAWRGLDSFIPFGEPSFSGCSSMEGPKVTMVGRMPDTGPIETMFWYLRATLAAYAQTVWLCASWDLLDRIGTVCRYNFYNSDPSSWGCTGDSIGRNVLIIILSLLLMWWSRCVSWNGGVDPTWQLGMHLLNTMFLSGYGTGRSQKFRSRWTISKEVKIGGGHLHGSYLEPNAAFFRNYSDEYGLLDTGLLQDQKNIDSEKHVSGELDENDPKIVAAQPGYDSKISEGVL